LTQNDKTNRLVNASSPYLQQHANNPVDWFEWGPEALQKARNENKPLLISIGYSACHWCHVMAHEVFENDDSASKMNANFINIKIDREERPDIDQVYMDAVQVLTGRGGWPLNIFALPDGRPFYGGTYFPKKDWDSILQQLNDLWQTKPDTVYEYATKLANGIKSSNVIELQKSDWNENDFHASINIIKSTWDMESGGFNRAPKFPLPVVYQFALHYFHLFHNPEVLDWIMLSLKRMSVGGLYDTVGGGYSRYSVDAQWHAPHFEKMLYDNGQMLSLLADTYMISNDALLLQKMNETHQFFFDEWMSEAGGLYSALDADSEGVEGKYYCYTWQDLQQIGIPSATIQQYFNLREQGNWEHGLNILFATQAPSEFAKANNIDLATFQSELTEFLNKLKIQRKHRIKPGLDDKILVSWNALAITGLVKCYKATNQTKFLNTAIQVASFIENHAWHEGKLYRNYKNGTASIPAFLEDYVLLAEALTETYQATFDVKYLTKARDILTHVVQAFAQDNNPFFVFNPDPEGELFVKKTDLGDDVIPSANSVLCELLLKHSFYFDNSDWRQLAENMLQSIRNKVLEGPAWYSRWLSAAMLQNFGINQVTVIGQQNQWPQNNYLPNTIVMNYSDSIPLTQSKSQAETGYYVCRDFECFAPETDLGKVLDRLY
jgi:uncharacterized protein YyaL (SSP411 family)